MTEEVTAASPPQAANLMELVARLEQRRPGLASQALELAVVEARRDYILRWAKLIAGFIGGLTSVGVLAYIALRYGQAGAHWQGTVLFVSGAGATVAVFLTGKYVAPRGPGLPPPPPPQ